jgi:PIN domain nuclease of toxin-antitoxin system
MSREAIYISSISAWEVAVLGVSGRMELTMTVQDWIAASEALPFFHFVPVDNTIFTRSVLLPGPLHSDPADRVIITTAIMKGMPLVTKDDRPAAPGSPIRPPTRRGSKPGAAAVSLYGLVPLVLILLEKLFEALFQ